MKGLPLDTIVWFCGCSKVCTTLPIDYFKISTFNAFESCYISFRHLSNPFANDELTIGQR